MPDETDPSTSLSSEPVHPPLITEKDERILAIIRLAESGDLRGKRRYLEAHPELLDPALTAPFVSQTASRHWYLKDREKALKLRKQLGLLDDIRIRGGTAEAIREAFTNAYGGLVLDLPSWLEAVVQQTATPYLKRMGQADQVMAELADKLRAAIAQARDDPGVPPEAVEELQAMLGNVLSARSPRIVSNHAKRSSSPTRGQQSYIRWPDTPVSAR